MNGDHWIHVLVQLAIQHLWLGAVFAIPALLLPKLRRRIGSDAYSWVLLVAFGLAVVSPFAIFLPNSGHALLIAPDLLVPGTSPVSTLHEGLQPATHTVVANVGAMAPIHQNPLILVGIAVWLAGLVWMLYRLVAGWIVARRLCAASRHRPDLEQRFAHVLQRDVMLRTSERISGPLVVGLLRPCVLLPRRLTDELAPTELTFALLHELAHIRRRDPWVSLFQALGLAVYCWSPLLWLIARRLDGSREMACDERAALRSGDAVACADALVKAAGKISISGHANAFAVGMLRNRTILTQRIEGLLQMNVNRCLSSKLVATGCGVLFLAGASFAVLAAPRIGNVPSAPTSAPRHAMQLIDAADAGRTDVIKQLVAQGTNINARVPHDGTALIVAAQRGDLGMVNALLKLGADVNEASLDDGNPLIAAAARGHLAVAKRLVAAGANVNAVVEFDETPLINAARSGGLAMVEYLVGQGADVNLGVLADGHRWRSPLNQARTDAIRDYLKSKGAAVRK
ncbi:MAG: M56 family metallopeptidase [Rhodanobacteraceae bacterium]